MSFKLSFLNSRVAHRILILFLLASLLPAGASILLSLGYTHHLYQNEFDKQLYQASKSYGLSLFERLDLLTASLRETAKFINASSTYSSASHAPGISLASMTEGMAILRPNGTVVPLTNSIEMPPAPDASQREFLAEGKSVVSSIIMTSGTQKQFITIAINPGRNHSDLLVARIKSRYLWGEPSTYPYLIDYGVFDSQNQLLFSSYPAADLIRARLQLPSNQSGNGTITWSDNKQGYQGSIRTLFLQANFAAPNWRVISISPKIKSEDSLSIFQTILIPTILLAVLLVSLFSISQIRRTLLPLEKLIGYTRHVSNREFKYQLNFSSGDEFDNLAMAFNSMSNRLARQFEAMTILSDIDRSILSSPDFRRVQIMVLNSMSTIMQARVLAIGIVEKHRPDSVQTCLLDTVSGTIEDSHPPLSPATRELLLNSPDGVTSNDTTINDSIFYFTENFDIKQAIVIPILIEDELAGLLGIGLDEENLDDIDLKVCRDIADRLAVTLSTMELDDKLFQRLNYDELTGLPNRQNLIKNMDNAINQARIDNSLVTVMYIDLDRFKNINDAYGHQAGDQILKQAANRIAACIGGPYTLSRFNADEFTVILPSLHDAMEASSVADRIIHALTEPFISSHIENYLGASIGIAIYPYDGETAVELLMRADTAMSYAKDTGRNRYAFFSEDMNRRVDEQLLLERELRQALDLGELELHYQPKINLSSGLVEGAEALVRWNHPVKGQIKPDVFIPLAEEIGMINRLGEWVLNRTCTQYQSWQAAGVRLPTIAVNVSTYQFKQNDFTDRIIEAIDRSGMDAARLELEVTESLIMENIEEAVEVLKALKDKRIKIAIDDFGTGYSSMSYLKTLPFDSLKIDRSFIKDLPDDKDSAAITRSVIAMAQALDKTIIAEGAETEEQIAFLRSHHCTYVQGYYYSRPLPADEFLAYVSGINKNAVA